MTKVITIDDDLLIGRMYSKKLEDAGYDVEFYSNGKAALKTIVKECPTLVVSDMMLPGMSGLEILKALKKNPKTKKIPMVFLTNLSKDEATIQQAIEIGSVGYLLKVEMSPEEIVARIKEYIEAYAPKKMIPESAMDRLNRIKRKS